MQSGLESILNVELSVNQWKQACLPIRDGGLGIRTATSLAPSVFLSSAVSSCDLQLEILPMLESIPDTDFTDNLTFWTTMTSGQPITGSNANKQRAWDEVYVDMVKINLLHDWLGPCTVAGSIRSTLWRLVTCAIVVELRHLSRQRSHPNRCCSAPWCHYVSSSWLPMWTNNWRSRVTLLLVLEEFRQAYAAQHFERHCVADNDKSQDTVNHGTLLFKCIQCEGWISDECYRYV